MAKKYKVKTGVKKGSSGNAVVRTMPAPLQNTYDIKHSTSAGRKQQHAADVRRIEKVFGSNWREKVFGDVNRYRQAFGKQRQERKRLTGLRNKESQLASQKGVPGSTSASDEALDRRIQNLQHKEGVTLAKAGQSGTTYANKRRFQRAARKAYNTQQKGAVENLRTAVKDKMDSKLARPTYRNPNSPFNVNKRKKKVRAAFEKAAKETSK